MKRKERLKKKNMLIKKYGSDILCSEEFIQAFSERHHLKSNVGNHSILTARMSLNLCKVLNRFGYIVDEENAVRISLLHDLGMLGRKEKYKNTRVCHRMHPIDSAITAKQIWNDIDRDSVAAIRNHMWPLTPKRPASREAYVLCVADKMAAVGDWFISKKKYEIFKNEADFSVPLNMNREDS